MNYHGNTGLTELIFHITYYIHFKKKCFWQQHSGRPKTFSYSIKHSVISATWQIYFNILINQRPVCTSFLSSELIRVQAFIDFDCFTFA